MKRVPRPFPGARAELSPRLGGDPAGPQTSDLISPLGSGRTATSSRLPASTYPLTGLTGRPV